MRTSLVRLKTLELIIPSYESACWPQASGPCTVLKPRTGSRLTDQAYSMLRPLQACEGGRVSPHEGRPQVECLGDTHIQVIP